MKYLFEGETLRLVKYAITFSIPNEIVMTEETSPELLEEANLEGVEEVIAETENQENPTENSAQVEQRTEYALSDEEKDRILQLYPNATVETVDNDGYEWLDGRAFTENEKAAGLVEKAIEMGEVDFEQYIIDTDPDAQMLEIFFRLSLLEMGVNADGISTD